MTGQKIYLTKSSEVANIIFNSKMKEKGVLPIMCSAYGCGELPIQMWDKELICVCVKYVDVKKPFYEIIEA